MAIDARNFSVTGQWAKNADTVIPPTPITGRTYRNPDMTREIAEAGTPYDTVWESSSNNQKDYEVSGIALQASKMGITIWSPLEDYVDGSIQIGTDGKVYRCIIPHGPNTEDPAASGGFLGPKDPTVSVNTGVGGYWLDFGEWLFSGGTSGSYLAVPDTLCLRSPGDARTQVGDAIDDMDAINKRTMIDYFHKNIGFGNVATPVILEPEDNAVQQSLSFQITTSPIELITGGEPSPLFTNYIVLNAAGLRIVGPVSVAYTTTPEIWVPESAIGQTVRIIVQHEDAVNGTSQWSDQKPVIIASVLANPVPVTSPARGSSGVIPVGLTVTIGEGSWSDGSAFTGSQSRIELFDEATGQSLYDSEWVAYKTDFAVPDGILTTSKGYWVRGQHRAASAPAANPGAVLTSPVVYRDSMAASYFYTTGPIPPNTGNLKHTIPSTVLKGTQVTVKIYGAVSLDGGKITYTINQNTITGGIGFSKYTGIEENEEIIMTAPNIAGATADASLRITAVSSFGAESTPVIVNIVILGQTIWIYDSPGQFQFDCPGPGKYDVYVGGGGGVGYATSSGNARYVRGAGGGGCGILRSTILNKSIYGLYVGKGGIYSTSTAGAQGESSSFAALVIGTGGQPITPGNGEGGTENYSGGAGNNATGSAAHYGRAGGGGGAGITNGANGPAAAQDTVIAGGAAGALPDFLTAKSGADGVASIWTYNNSVLAYGGKGSIGGGGGGSAATYNNFNFGNGGHGSVIIVFREGLTE